MPRLSEDYFASLDYANQGTAQTVFAPVDISENVPRVVRDRVEQLVNTLNSYQDVADELGLSVDSVKAIHEEARSRWNRRRILDRAVRVDEELAHLENIRAMCLDHYERSRQNTTETRRERTIEPRETLEVENNLGETIQLNTGIGGRSTHKFQRKTTRRDGELQALRLAMDVGKEIRSMLGIDAPEVKRLQLEGHVSVNIDSGQLAQMGPAELAELHRFAIEQSKSA